MVCKESFWQIEFVIKRETRLEMQDIAISLAFGGGVLALLMLYNRFIAAKENDEKRDEKRDERTDERPEFVEFYTCDECGAAVDTFHAHAQLRCGERVVLCRECGSKEWQRRQELQNQF